VSLLFTYTPNRVTNRLVDLSTARKLLGPDKIIGVTASTVDEALKACEGGVDYLGIGTVYATPT
jgi:thiamine-phosphate diphosphorylase/hydroxyethylthiazole kinase